MIKNINNNIFDDKKLNDLTLESFSSTHNDIAKVFYYLIKDKYIIFKKDCQIMCIYFDNKWNCECLDEVYKIFDDLYNHYKIVMTHYQSQLGDNVDENVNVNIITLKQVTKILQRLHSHSIKNHILSSLRSYYNPDDALNFYNQLDDFSNRKVLGFKNCVYDFNTKLFRQCLPTDMIMNICDYDYKTSSGDKQSRLKEILLQIFNINEGLTSGNTQQNLDLFLSIVVNMLTVQNTKDNCLILHGRCAGKSTLCNLINKTFKNLCAQIPSSKYAPNIRMLYSSEKQYAKQRILTTIHEHEHNKSDTIEDCINFMFRPENKLLPQNMIIFSDNKPQLEKIRPLILKSTQFNVINLPNEFVATPELENEKLRDSNLCEELNNLNCAFIDILISNF